MKTKKVSERLFETAFGLMADREGLDRDEFISKQMKSIQKIAKEFTPRFEFVKFDEEDEEFMVEVIDTISGFNLVANVYSDGEIPNQVYYYGFRLDLFTLEGLQTYYLVYLLRKRKKLAQCDSQFTYTLDSELCKYLVNEGFAVESEYSSELEPTEKAIDWLFNSVP